jgi:hypothetical protein
MVNKEKISKVDVYDSNGTRLLSTKEVFFPKDFFRIKGKELVLIKDKKMPLLERGQMLEVVFEYINGTRVKYLTTVDICTEYQLNFHLGDGVTLTERRRSYKVNAEFEGCSEYYIRNEEMFYFSEPLCLHFKNINLGGTFFNADYEFVVGDQIMMSFLDGKIEIISEILRIQNDEQGKIQGYGCKFLNIAPHQEECIARFIFECQIAEREKMKGMGIH